MFGIGVQEIIIIVIIALIVVGPKKLPELAKSLGKGFNEFKKATDGITEDIKDTLKEDKADTKTDNEWKNSLLMKKPENEKKKSNSSQNTSHE